MDKEPTQSERPKTWVTEGILIASVPVYVYVLILSYVIGFCDFFEIPFSFVSLNLPTMYWIGLRLGVILFLLLLVTALAYRLLRSFLTTKASTIIFPLLPFAGILFLQIALGLPWRDWRLTLGIMVAVAIHMGLSSSVHFPSLPSSISPDELNVLRRASLVFPWITWLMMVVSVAENMGRSKATHQRDYLVPASAPTTVVLSHFGERLIVAPFDRSTKEVERSFLVIKAGEDPKLLLRWESVGPLHPKPEGGSSTPASATTPPQPPKPSSPEKHAP